MDKHKIVFALLPYWTPLIPPLGLACLKSYLKESKCDVITIDANIDLNFRRIYDEYMRILKDELPKDRHVSLNKIGNELLRHHIMIRYNYDVNININLLIQSLVNLSFYYSIDELKVKQLNLVIDKFNNYLINFIDDIINTHNPDIIGLSLYPDTLPASSYVFRYIKTTYPHIKTIAGGSIFSQELAIDSPNFNHFMRKVPYIDNIFVGEGEILIRKFIEGEIPDSQKIISAKDIENQLLDIDNTPLPCFENIPLEYYMYLSNYTSRGCPFMCSFCAETVSWVKYRKKNIVNFVNELRFLKAKYNKKLFLLTDSLLNPTIDKISEVISQCNDNYYFDAYMRIDNCTSQIEKTKQWRRSGLYRVRLGIESGSQKMLDLMNKKIKVSTIKESLVSLSESGIKTTTYWVIGHPGENESDFNASLNLLTEMKDYIYEAESAPFKLLYSGQSNSDIWEKQYEKQLLFPENIQDYLLYHTWILDSQPNREEIYHRFWQFETHRIKLNIPNPYSLEEIYKADIRWKSLHANAVPDIFDIHQ